MNHTVRAKQYAATSSRSWQLLLIAELTLFDPLVCEGQLVSRSHSRTEP